MRSRLFPSFGQTVSCTSWVLSGHSDRMELLNNHFLSSLRTKVSSSLFCAVILNLYFSLALFLKFLDSLNRDYCSQTLFKSRLDSFGSDSYITSSKVRSHQFPSFLTLHNNLLLLLTFCPSIT